MTIQQYSMRKYAKVLCTAVKAYNFPPVIYDFERGVEIDFRRKKEIPPYLRIREVEKRIQPQMFSQDPESVKDGLSNVLYWGCAGPKLRNLRWNWISDLRNAKTHKFEEFSHIARDLTGPGLVKVKDVKLPKFSQMPFVSKIRMFLDPGRYPVLDTNIFRLTNLPHFPPLQGMNRTLAVNGQSEQVYENWALWCKCIAETINAYDDSPLKDLRAVDIERGIFQLMGSDREDDQIKVHCLLLGPAKLTTKN